MSKTKNGGFSVKDLDVTVEKDEEKKSGKGKKPGTVKRSGNKRTAGKK